jgi:hypothetical protein
MRLDVPPEPKVQKEAVESSLLVYGEGGRCGTKREDPSLVLLFLVALEVTERG